MVKCCLKTVTVASIVALSKYMEHGESEPQKSIKHSYSQINIVVQ